MDRLSPPLEAKPKNLATALNLAQENGIRVSGKHPLVALLDEMSSPTRF
jgi:hypothetical protein